MGVRRAGTGRYRGRLERVPIPDGATRRERIMATTQALASAFERVIATAPDQWWAVFFPIWPDLEAAAAAANTNATETDTGEAHDARRSPA
jgi:hypothetical protein